MGFLNSATHFVGTVVQGTTDTIANGPMGPIMRQQLNNLHDEINRNIGTYGQLHSTVNSYRDPVNNLGKYTSSMLHQTSDYLHGLAVNYDKIISDSSINLPNIRHLGNANIVQPFMNTPIPGTFGGFPSALIPGVETLKMMEGLINVFASSFTLSKQLNDAKNNLNKSVQYIRQIQNVERELEDTANYLLTIDNNLLTVFHRTTGISFPHLAGGSPNAVANAVNKLKNQIERITNVKGNAFMMTRFMINLIKKKNISKANNSQISWIASKLYAIDSVKTSFGGLSNVTDFVRNFFGGQLLTPGVLLHIPTPPPDISKYITENPPSHQAFSDPNSSKYDPPSIDPSSFPS